MKNLQMDSPTSTTNRVNDAFFVFCNPTIATTPRPRNKKPRSIKSFNEKLEQKDIINTPGSRVLVLSCLGL